MAMRSSLSRLAFVHLAGSSSMEASSFVINRRFSGGKKILSEEERAAETIYIQKMEKERLEKAKIKAEKEKEKAEAEKTQDVLGRNIGDHKQKPDGSHKG